MIENWKSHTILSLTVIMHPTTCTQPPKHTEELTLSSRTQSSMFVQLVRSTGKTSIEHKSMKRQPNQLGLQNKLYNNHWISTRKTSHVTSYYVSFIKSNKKTYRKEPQLHSLDADKSDQELSIQVEEDTDPDRQ